MKTQKKKKKSGQEKQNIKKRWQTNKIPKQNKNKQKKPQNKYTQNKNKTKERDRESKKKKKIHPISPNDFSHVVYLFLH